MNPFLPPLISAIFTAAIFAAVLVTRAWLRQRRAAAEQRAMQNWPARSMAIMRPARLYFDRKPVGECSGSRIEIGPDKTSIEADVVFFEKAQSVDFVDAVTSCKNIEVHILLGETPYVTIGTVSGGKVISDWKTGECRGSFLFTGGGLTKTPQDVHVLRGPSSRPGLVFPIPLNGSLPESSIAIDAGAMA